jgi:opacity protein-like surface antigen
LLPDGATPSLGADITTALASAGDYTQPAASTALMYTLGGGVTVPLAQHWGVDAGYRYSRVASDTPVNVQGATFGVGYRF